MSDIVLLAVNARWSHSAFGARYLLANLGPLKSRARLIEATVNDRSPDIVERVLAERPRIVGLGAYVWNVGLCDEILGLLRAAAPDITLVLGGPEVICPEDRPDAASNADFVINGEAEHEFRRLCTALLSGAPPASRSIAAAPPDLDSLELPYDLYSDDDIRYRKIYVEASRGCPYGCEFCLSSLDTRVRKVPAARFLPSLESLWERGARHFKFVDRAMHTTIGTEILEFFLDRLDTDTFLHFEVVPDRLPDDLMSLLARFPDGVVQLEAGVQSFDPEIARRIGRHHDIGRLETNLTRLRRETGVHLHTDLIVGLPGESLAGFGAGFDRLIALEPHEIQVGLLKRLRGTPLACRGPGPAVFNPKPPYEVVRTDALDYSEVQRMRRFARYFDLVCNSGNFRTTASRLVEHDAPFRGFLEFSDWLFETSGRTHHISMNRLARFVARFLIEIRGIPCDEVQDSVNADYAANRRKPIPLLTNPNSPRKAASGIPHRQKRHRG